MGNNVGIPAVPAGTPREMAFFLQALSENVRILAGSARGSNASRAVREYERSGMSNGTGQAILGTASLEPQSVTASKIADKAVTEAKIADGAVSTAKIAHGAVTGAHITGKAVSYANLDDNAVTARSISTGAVSGEKLGTACVTTDKIADTSITLEKMADGVIPTIPEPPEIPLLAFVGGTATDGSSVEIPQAFSACPIVVLVNIFGMAPTKEPPDPPTAALLDALPDQPPVTPPEVCPDVMVGATDITEILGENSEKTGMWKFTAVGAFSWVAIGYETLQK